MKVEQEFFFRLLNICGNAFAAQDRPSESCIMAMRLSTVGGNGFAQD
jgi:hypothetical protein